MFFTPVCDSVHRWVSARLHARLHSLGRQPLPFGYYGIRSTSWLYASYLNTYPFDNVSCYTPLTLSKYAHNESNICVILFPSSVNCGTASLSTYKFLYLKIIRSCNILSDKCTWHILLHVIFFAIFVQYREEGHFSDPYAHTGPHSAESAAAESFASFWSCSSRALRVLLVFSPRLWCRVFRDSGLMNFWWDFIWLRLGDKMGLTSPLPSQ